MRIEPLKIGGTYRVTLDPKRDERGYFARVYDDLVFSQNGLTASWVQENQSFSRHKDTIRGLHCLLPPYTETKLIRVVSGMMLGVFADLRVNSPTYGQWDAIELSAENFTMVYLPKGLANGFCTLTDNVTVVYKVDSSYVPECDAGIRWNDPTLNIEWPTSAPILSQRDSELPLLTDFASPF